MARGPSIPLSINGEVLSTRQFNERLVETLRVYGESGGSAKEVAEDWGDAIWQDPDNRRRLSNRMNFLCDQGTLTKTKWGRYVVNEERIENIGISMSAQTEHQIIKAMRDRGGFAVMSEIAGDFGIEQTRFDEEAEGSSRVRVDNSDYANLRRAIQRSTVIRKAFGLSKAVGDARKDVYFLSGELMRSTPLTGAHALMMLAHQLGSGSETAEVELAFDRHCTAVASAVVAIMDVGGLTFAELEAQLAPAMKGWYARYPSARRVKDYQRYTREHQDDDEFALEQGFEESVNERVFSKFVDGDTDAHRTAPLAFYYALAEALLVDAPMLSRGSIEIAY